MTRIDEVKGWPDSFSSRVEAEQFIAENGQAGKKKARRVLSRWHLVPNTRDTLTLSQFIQCAIVEVRRRGSRLPVSKIAYEASLVWNNLKAERQTR
jgi:hypothetical protein